MSEPSSEKMRCHYEVMDVNMTCGVEDIKKQYKKLALKWHPDRNHGQEELATKNFKELSAAYAVLSDPQERKWYDDHREAILRGGDGTSNDDEDGDQRINLWKYFNSTCYSGSDDSPAGFFAVYGTVFDCIDRQELDHVAQGSKSVADHAAPAFGGADSPVSAVLGFYSHWENFVSRLSFSWEDKYNLTDAPNRQTKRAMEKENLKFREAAKKEFTSLVRSLTLHVKKRDARYLQFEEDVKRKKLEEEERKASLKAQETLRRKDAREARLLAEQYTPEELESRERERKSAFLLADDDSDLEAEGEEEGVSYTEAELQTRLRELKVGAAAQQAAEPEDDRDDDEEAAEQQEYACEMCSKSFKSEAQLTQHLASKVHRKRAQELQKKSKAAAAKTGKKSTAATEDD